MKKTLFTYECKFKFKNDEATKAAEAIAPLVSSIETSPIARNQLVQYTIKFNEAEDFRTFLFWYERIADGKTVTEEELSAASFDLDVSVMNKKNVVGHYIFKECNPVVIQPLALNVENTNEGQCTVTFIAKQTEIIGV